MEFNLAEKLAIIKAMDEVIHVDGTVNTSELKIMNQLMRMLEFDKKLLDDAREVNSKEALLILGAMNASKKKTLALILDKVANADGKVHYKEINLILNIFESVGIKCEYRFWDYFSLLYSRMQGVWARDRTADTWYLLKFQKCGSAPVILVLCLVKYPLFKGKNNNNF